MKTGKNSQVVAFYTSQVTVGILLLG